LILAESKFALDLIVSSLCGLAVIFKLGSTNQFKASAFNGAGWQCLRGVCGFSSIQLNQLTYKASVTRCRIIDPLLH